MKIQLRIEVPLCSYPPKGYGAAYEDWEKRRMVCYPFPLNWIVAITLKFWHRVRHTKYMIWDLNRIGFVEIVGKRLPLVMHFAELVAIKGIEHKG